MVPSGIDHPPPGKFNAGKIYDGKPLIFAHVPRNPHTPGKNHASQGNIPSPRENLSQPPGESTTSQGSLFENAIFG